MGLKTDYRIWKKIVEMKIIVILNTINLKIHALLFLALFN